MSGSFAASFNGTGFHDGVFMYHCFVRLLYIFRLSFIFGHVSGFTTFIAKINPIIVHRSSVVGHVSRCSVLVFHVYGSIISCQNTIFIASSAASIHVNSALNSVIAFHVFAA